MHAFTTKIFFKKIISDVLGNSFFHKTYFDKRLLVKCSFFKWHTFRFFLIQISESWCTVFSIERIISSL